MSRDKETNYEHNYVTDADGSIVPEKRATFDPGGDIKGSTKIEIRAPRRQPEQADFMTLGERMLLALQGIDVSLDQLVKHKNKEVKEKKNLALMNGLTEETGSERLD